MKIDLRFAGVLVVGAVATSALVLVATDGGGEPDGTGPGAGPFAAPGTAAPSAGGAGAGAGGAGAAGAAGNGAGTSRQPQNLPLPGSQKRIGCPDASITVKNGGDLQNRLNVAEPGQVIRLAPGTYRGRFATQKSGTPDKPVFLCGGPRTILDGGDAGTGYGLHLDGASHWRLLGFTVRNSQKGVMLDGSSGSVVQGLTVRDTGDEAIHLRRFSSGNAVQYNSISGTGRRNPRFGEGVYLGSSHNNWGTLTQGRPDRSDNNLVAANRIRATAEAVDIKEGTTGGKLTGNVFDGSELSGDKVNDSWVDAKGNDYVIEGNRGARTVADGFQTHEEYQGWGTGNVFRRNVIDLGGAKGFGVNLNSGGNRVACDNRVRGGRLINKGTCS
ncbi:right-handed parallel beta-helix repeat-containing protein [Spirillospora sp. NBC_01491]|uniref:right-handed parallel beta-helix repeat-containing protein n=1 Tax=Spirillospora sp. NBC_01491 TaxID=2976007 RepID=UPI002E351842|nr:right-handed parallel beta-helix repeat-containing protein [Spirillospora sp. NBC_01491]